MGGMEKGKISSISGLSKPVEKYLTWDPFIQEIAQIMPEVIKVGKCPTRLDTQI